MRKILFTVIISVFITSAHAKTYNNIDGTPRFDVTRDGDLNGILKSYYPDGSIKNSFNFRKGKLHGIQSTYQEDGTLAREDEFKNDVAQGIERIYSNEGVLIFEGKRTSGLRDSTYYYYENGNKVMEIYYNDGIVTGGRCTKTKTKFTKDDINSANRNILPSCDI